MTSHLTMNPGEDKAGNCTDCDGLLEWKKHQRFNIYLKCSHRASKQLTKQNRMGCVTQIDKAKNKILSYGLPPWCKIIQFCVCMHVEGRIQRLIRAGIEAHNWKRSR